MLTCINHSLRVIDSNHLVMETTMQHGTRPCRALFLVMKGAFMGMPGGIGLKKTPGASVMAWAGLRYDLRIAEGAAARATVHRQERYVTREAEISERQRVEKKRERIVERHGGRIGVVSEGKGRGSTFNFRLPQNRAALHHD